MREKLENPGWVVIVVSKPGVGGSADPRPGWSAAGTSSGEFAVMVVETGSLGSLH